MPRRPAIRATTILAVRARGSVVMAADGQVTMGDIVVKHRARKLRTTYGGRVLIGFAGAAADGLALSDRFETQLERHGGQLRRAAIELAKDWRTDRYLRRLEAQLLIADPNTILMLSGDGEIIEPDDSVAAIGSGGAYAQAAAAALVQHTNLTGEEVVRAAMGIAASLCIYTNVEVHVETVDAE